MKSLFTTNLKFAVTLDTLGVPFRNPDPITCIKQDNGEDQFTFWYEATDDALLYERAWKEGWETKILDKHHLTLLDKNEKPIPHSHPFFYCFAWANNREGKIHQMYRAEKMILKNFGDITLLISSNANEKTKSAMRKAIHDAGY